MITPALGSTNDTTVRTRRLSRERLQLLAVLALATGLYALGLARNGYANEYYAAAVKSMVQSWHNFFYVAFDPGGFVAVDKPPLALWVQAASAKLFGVNSYALMLPQAVEGVLSVAVVYHLVRRVWGHRTGLLAAIVMTLTPITVAINRDNNPDTLLVLLMVLAAWAAIRATETGRLRLVVLCAALVGLAFNTKMLQGLIVVPALGLLYLVGSRVTWRRRAMHLAAAAATLVVVGGAWSVAVDLTPAAQRPYVGGSTTNTMRDLIFGYNGLGRLSGNENGRGARQGGPPAGFGATGEAPDVAGGLGGPMGGISFGGQPGVLRLFTAAIAGQMVWLLPLALGGAAVGLRRARPRFPLSQPAQNLVLWAAWLATHLVVFSFAQGIFHPYYLTVVGPAWAVLIAVGTRAMWRAWQAGGPRRWALPAALLVTAGWQTYLLWPTSADATAIRAALYALIAVAALGALGAAAWLARRGLDAPGSGRRVLGGALVALLVAPGVWSATPLVMPGNSSIPTAGLNASSDAMGGPPAGVGAPLGLAGAPPAGADDGRSAGQRNRGARPAGAPGFGTGGFRPGDRLGGDQSKLIAYLEANRGATKYLLAVGSSMSASGIILATGAPVMALGGFSGGDPILTAEQFAALVRAGTVRFVQAQAGGRGGPGGPGGQGNQAAITSWVTQNCTAVDPALWQSSATPAVDLTLPPGVDLAEIEAMFGDQLPDLGGGQLYDCAAAK